MSACYKPFPLNGVDDGVLENRPKDATGGTVAGHDWCEGARMRLKLHSLGEELKRKEETGRKEDVAQRSEGGL